MAPQPIEPGGGGAADSFGAFYHSWHGHLQILLDQLLPLLLPHHRPTDDRLPPLVNQVLLHYNHYFGEASKLACRDVLLLFSAPWLSPFERTFLWIGGFRPTLIFRLIDAGDLAADQARRVEELRAETKMKERELRDAMAELQESVAAPPLLGLLRRQARGPLVDGELSHMESAAAQLEEAMRAVVEGANTLRGATVMSLIEILKPVQAVRFLAAAAQFQLRLRRWWGLEENSHFP